jgi:hypothetical protein
LARDVRLDLALSVERERYRTPLVTNFDADLDRPSGCGSLDALQGFAKLAHHRLEDSFLGLAHSHAVDVLLLFRRREL